MIKPTVDPITTEVVGKAFQSIAEEMGAALIHSAYSTNIKERRDCSCAVFAPDGSLIVMAEHIPIHLGSMQGLMNEVSQNLERWDLKPGDVIIANDPYRGGGSHLPDITLVQPVFFKRKLVSFVANIAHWSDVGGIAPGVGTAGSLTEIFQEGLRIPPVRIISQGQVRPDVLELLLRNMRNHEERLGDFRAQTASLQLGVRRTNELFDRYGVDLVGICVSEIFDYSERRLRSALLEIPEGRFSFSDAMDDDGVSENPLPIHVAVTITHGKEPRISFDFTGTSSQAEGGINMVWSALLATVYYAVKAVVCPDVSPNAGFQRSINVQAEKSSLVNALEPAPVGGRTDTCQRVVDVILGALSEVVPERVIAASNGATTALIFGGTAQLAGRDFVYVEAQGGGMGARMSKDGMDGVQVHITNTSNLPIEAMEMEYPLRVLRYCLVPDSGGPGKFRGGLSIRKDIHALSDVLFSAHSDRHRLSPWGLKGGYPGAKGYFRLNPGKPTQKRILSKVSGVLIRKGEVLSVQTAGGGGYGSPLERDAELVARDCAQGYISPEAARETFGVVLSQEGEVDKEKTSVLRERLKRKDKR